MNRQELEKLYPEQWAALRLTATNINMPVDGYARRYKANPNTKVNIAIPTLGLRSQITDVIDSLLTSTYQNICIVILVSENIGIIKQLKSLYGDKIEIIFEPKRLGWVDEINIAAKRKGDLFLLGDDVCVMRDTIEILMSEMDRLFPDGDGVLTTNHTNTCSGTSKPGWAGAFPLVGNKFIDRFPDRQILCPDYHMYASDVELPDFAISINKYFQIMDAHVLHFGKQGGITVKDSTSKWSGRTGMTDHETYCIRRQKGFLWGKNFDLIKGGA